MKDREIKKKINKRFINLTRSSIDFFLLIVFIYFLVA